MGEAWIRTTGNGLIRADRITEITSTRGSLHADRGYLLKVIVDGKGHVVIDDGDLPGSPDSRLEHVRHLEDELLFAIDQARNSEASTIITFAPDSLHWTAVPVAALAGRLPQGV